MLIDKKLLNEAFVVGSVFVLLVQLEKVKFDVAFWTQKYFGGLKITKYDFELLEVSGNIQQTKHHKA